MLNRGLDKQELLRIVDSVANEKSIDKELILSSMEKPSKGLHIVSLVLIMKSKLKLIEITVV